MMRTAVAGVAYLLLGPAGAAAHGLDEYLQASRVSLERRQVTIEVDLTPGANIASAILPLLDVDADGVVSPAEARAYGEQVLADLNVELDGRRLGPSLTRVEVPSAAEMQDGLGTIRIRAASDLESVPAGRRELFFTNNHQPAGSVYLANALLPQDDGIHVLAQTRDIRQRGISVSYEVAPAGHRRLAWPLAGSGVLVMLVALRARARQATSSSADKTRH